MVVRRPASVRRNNDRLDRLFRALADRTRRDIVARVLAGEEASVSALATHYAMSFAAVQKHVAVLASAGVVTKHARGRERLVRGNPKELARARELLAELELRWTSRFSQLDAILAEPTQPMEQRCRSLPSLPIPNP
jgi:DNA-binding transcriptional ArsR family regulator